MAILPSVPSFTEMGIGPTGATAITQPQGPEVNTPSADAITSGSQLDRTAIGPWPAILPAGLNMFTAWVRNGFHDFFKASVGANYGLRGSVPHWSFLGSEYNPANNGLGRTAIAGYPGPVRAANRPTYDNLVAISWNQVTLSALNMDPTAFANIQSNPAEFVPGGTASLGITAPVVR